MRDGSYGTGRVPDSQNWACGRRWPCNGRPKQESESVLSSADALTSALQPSYVPLVLPDAESLSMATSNVRESAASSYNSTSNRSASDERSQGRPVLLAGPSLAHLVSSDLPTHLRRIHGLDGSRAVSARREPTQSEDKPTRSAGPATARAPEAARQHLSLSP